MASEVAVPKTKHVSETKGSRLSGAPYVPTDKEQQLDAIRRDEASAIAADMEMGYYQTRAGEQWEPKPYVLREILRAMGYSDTIIVKVGRLRWWPGQDAFRKIVSWKVAVRKMQAHLDLTRQNAWAGPLIGMAVEQMGWRLAHRPNEVSDRDLTELITKLTRIFADGAPASGGSAPRTGDEAKSLQPGAVRFTRITESIDLLPEGPAKEKARRDYIELVEQARAALPAPVE